MPSDTLSPTLMRTSFTTPADGEGISIVALSLSSVTSDCSGATVSPGLTRISMTSTLLKSPMSGTSTSCIAPIDSPYTVAGFGFAGSMPYFLIASATSECLSAPPSASALSAEIVTQ